MATVEEERIKSRHRGDRDRTTDLVDVIVVDGGVEDSVEVVEK